MSLAEEFDQITAEQLRRAGSLKWTLYPGTIGAFVAEMDFGTAPQVRSALHRAVDAEQFGYLPAAMVDEMAIAVAQWQHARYGWEISAEQVKPVPDVIMALEVAIDHFTTPGSAVILPTPAYMPFLAVPGLHQRELHTVDLIMVDGRATLDLEGLDAAFAAGAELLILCNPYNPVGRVFDRDELEAISQVVERHGGRVFADEIHAPLVYAPHEHLPYASLSPATARHTITATSASKAWNLPGLKCAQLIFSNDNDLETWTRIGAFAGHSTANLGVIATTAALTEGIHWLDEVVHYLDGNRRHVADLLAEHLPQIGYTPPEGTYIGWFDCRRLDLGPAPAQMFREQASVALTEGLECGQAGAGHVRMIMAAPRPVLTQAVEQLAQAVARRTVGSR